ncbi:MAG: hypothetical protein WEB62_03015 [Bacteroidota bacterium]
MKTMRNISILCFAFAFILSGCGKSDEQVKKVAALELELSQLQMQLRPQLHELNKLAWQLDSISKSKDKIAVSMANDIQTAIGLITEAYKPVEGIEGAGPTFQTEFDKLPKALEANIDVIKRVIEKTSSAINKSHEVIEAYNKQMAKKK